MENLKHIELLAAELDDTCRSLDTAINTAQEMSGVSKSEFENFPKVKQLREIQQNAEKIADTYNTALTGNQLELINIDEF